MDKEYDRYSSKKKVQMAHKCRKRRSTSLMINLNGGHNFFLSGEPNSQGFADTVCGKTEGSGREWGRGK